MSNMNITHIVNVTSGIPNHFEVRKQKLGRQMKYLKINIEDNDSEFIKTHFKLAFHFIDDAFFSPEGLLNRQYSTEFDIFQIIEEPTANPIKSNLLELAPTETISLDVAGQST